jgi:hypothetical protein
MKKMFTFLGHPLGLDTSIIKGDSHTIYSKIEKGNITKPIVIAKSPSALTHSLDLYLKDLKIVIFYNQFGHDQGFEETK